MGVYHLMGLGRSPGAITGPLSYLSHRYQRWNTDDQRFFSRSGEVVQRRRGDKVGDVQALILFTTREVLTGQDQGSPFISYNYIENPPGRTVQEPEKQGGPMKAVLGHLLRREWPGISGDRSSGPLFWCQVDRRDMPTTYQCVIQVVSALAGAGGQGHEMWINLTSGNNVTNFALELAATLSGDVARVYYVQAEDRTAERCVRFTAGNGYWVDLPVMPLALGRLSGAVMELVSRKLMNSEQLFSTLRSQYWDLSRGLDSEKTLQEDYLKPLWKQGLIAETRNGYTIGPQWKLIQPYEKALKRARQAGLTIEALSRQADWIEREIINFD